jgi:hypothetical protein
MPPPCARARPAAMLIKLSIALSSVANLRTFGRMLEAPPIGRDHKDRPQVGNGEAGLRDGSPQRLCGITAGDPDGIRRTIRTPPTLLVEPVVKF